MKVKNLKSKNTTIKLQIMKEIKKRVLQKEAKVITVSILVIL